MFSVIVLDLEPVFMGEAKLFWLSVFSQGLMLAIFLKNEWTNTQKALAP